MLTPPLSMWLLSYPKLLPLFCHEWQRASHWKAVISLSSEELAPSSSSASSSLEPSSSPSSSEAYGDGDRDVVKPPMTTCHAIRPTWVFTWHNSSLRVSRRASVCSSWAMMASRVTPLVEEKGAEVDGVKEAGGVIVSFSGHFGRSWGLLHLTDAPLMAPIMVKWVDSW